MSEAKYRTLADLLQRKIKVAYEDEENYYVRLVPDSPYDNVIWRVDKADNACYPMLITKFLVQIGKTREIDVGRLRRGNFLKHHGIKGQEWGVRHGPPYPLQPGQFRSNKKRSSRNITSKERAAEAIDRLLNRENGLRRLKNPESLESTISKVNDYKDDERGMYNCTSCALAGYLRTQGYNVKAIGSRKPFLPTDVYDKSIKNDVWSSTSASNFKNKKSAESYMLKMTGGKDASGVIGVEWGPFDGAHAFNWQVKGGKVRFYDCQLGDPSYDVTEYFNYINHSGEVGFYTLSNAEFDWKEVRKWVR